MRNPVARRNCAAAILTCVAAAARSADAEPSRFVGSWEGTGALVSTEALGTRGRQAQPVNIKLEVEPGGQVTFETTAGCGGSGVAQPLGGRILQLRLKIEQCRGAGPIEFRGTLQGSQERAALNLLYQEGLASASGALRRFSVTGMVALRNEER